FTDENNDEFRTTGRSVDFDDDVLCMTNNSEMTAKFGIGEYLEQIDELNETTGSQLHEQQIQPSSYSLKSSQRGQKTGSQNIEQIRQALPSPQFSNQYNINDLDNIPLMQLTIKDSVNDGMRDNTDRLNLGSTSSSQSLFNITMTSKDPSEYQFMFTSTVHNPLNEEDRQDIDNTNQDDKGEIVQEGEDEQTSQYDYYDDEVFEEI
ncbi:MAG: hypothetical protein EZS28_054717, partial [Streblomastix strix]